MSPNRRSEPFGGMLASEWGDDGVAGSREWLEWFAPKGGRASEKGFADARNEAHGSGGYFFFADAQSPRSRLIGTNSCSVSNEIAQWGEPMIAEFLWKYEQTVWILSDPFWVRVTM